MKKLAFVTTLYQYDMTKQVIDPSVKTHVVLSRRHPRKGTTVNTELFVEALKAYVSNRRAVLSMCKSYKPSDSRVPQNYVDVDGVLEIYHRIFKHEVETAVTAIMDSCQH